MTAFLEGLGAGYGIAIPVGAVAVLIVSRGLQHGFRAGLMAGAGAATADLFYAILSSLAGAALAVALQPIAAPLRILSGLALIALAVSTLWRRRQRVDIPAPVTARRPPLRTYAQFLGLTLINPLTVVYFTAFILGRDPGLVYTPLQNLWFVLGVGLASLSWQTGLAMVGGLAHSRLSPRFHLTAVWLGNLLVIGLGLRILLATLIAP